MNNRKLVLENGQVFEGVGFGSLAEVKGEIVFTTGMTGYQESITDPSFHQQLLVFTYPVIGNYGINITDFESLGYGASAVIVEEYCEKPSHWEKTTSLDAFMKQKNIPGISQIDTRKLVKIIREEGTVRGKICDIEEDTTFVVGELKDFTAEKHVPIVSTKNTYHVPGKGERVVIIDFGMKKSILSELTKRECDVIVVPYDTPASEILSYKPKGIILSNGPGNPADLPESINIIKELNGKAVIFGICLGHQLYALANNATTYKLLFGHRGGNHPVYDIAADKVYITSQNHSFTVDEKSIAGTDLEITQIALNDKTIEGLQHKTYPAFTVQYHPESSPGPLDTNDLFNRFLTMITENEKREEV